MINANADCETLSKVTFDEDGVGDIGDGWRRGVAPSPLRRMEQARSIKMHTTLSVPPRPDGRGPF
jgi:hypothetical protein